MALLGSLLKRGVALQSRLARNNAPALVYQTKTLRKLLRKAQQTAFGKHFGFGEMLNAQSTIKAFQEAVPIYDYDSLFDAWWHRTLEQEADVCWPGRVSYFALSSGTSGSPSKYIPITKAQIKAIRRAGVKCYLNLDQFDLGADFYTRGMMMLGGTTDLQDQGGYFTGDLTGINASKIPFWLRGVSKPGQQISNIADWQERIHEIAKHAPKWDVGSMMGIPSWIQLMIEHILAEHKAAHIHEIWPNLKMFVHGGVAFEPYRKGFDRLLGEPIEYMDTYLASEGFIAAQARPDTRSMRMFLNNQIFFEFIPFNSSNFTEQGDLKPDAQAQAIHEVQLDQDYALLMSTPAGAWRYLIGDTIRFTDVEAAEIIITGRTKHFLSICGEHLSVDNMNQAVEMTSQALDTHIQEFTVVGLPDGDSFKHRWYLGCDNTIEPANVKATLDKHLRSLNADYATERDHVLGMEVVIIPARLFYEWQKHIGRLGGQGKVPRVMKRDRFVQWESFLLQDNT